ncbi:MAG: DUF5752 family protein [Candidatus Bathyarchaeia archaeon]
MASLASRILRKLPREAAFYFFTSIGNYTGESAASLEEFVEKIKEFDTRSLEFHLYRGDFEEWVIKVLGDDRLSEEIKNVRSLSLTGNALRSKLYGIISKRYEELKRGFQS